MASNNTIMVAGSKASNTCQLAEVSSIKATFPNRCRVISDVEEFSNVVTIQPENLDATIKFQLPTSYPSVIPEIAIRSESLTEENIADVRQILKSKARELLGQQMIIPLVGEAEAHLRVLGLKPGKLVHANSHTYLDRHNKKKGRKQKVKSNSEDETQDKKLPSMKTADDVVKRIIWDASLEKDDFIVGYFDRFQGLVEKCFSAFSWEDLASVDYDVLAVPKHRIQYFKYKTVKVWDKTKRIDNVFGSAEGTKTIDVVMKELQELVRLGHTEEGSTESCVLQNKNSDEDINDSDENDSDSCGIEVIVGNSACATTNDYVKEKYSKSGCRAVASNCDKCKEDLQNKKETHCRNYLRPTHFLCIRITNDEIQDKIGKLQDDLTEKESIFRECCIPCASLHLTLSTLGLDTPDQINQCIDALTKMKPFLESALPTFNLRLHGVSHFNNQVIYAQIQHQKGFHEFCNLLKKMLEEAFVEVRDGYEFVPHVTILKISRPVARSRGTKYISPELYSSHILTDFGQQKVDNICLCSIGKERREDGFYLTQFELQFTS